MGYFALGKVLGAGKGLLLNDGGLGFRFLLKMLLKLNEWNKLLRWKVPSDRGAGATTFVISIGWLAR